MGKRISYTIWGTTKQKNDWIEWYNNVKSLFNEFGYAITHIGIISQSFKSNKILTISRNEKKIVKALQDGEIPNSIECYSLQPNFRTAMFDYEILCIRNVGYMTFVINDTDLNLNREKKIITFEKKFITIEKGEVYSTTNKEVPMIYAETKDSTNLATYEFIKKIQ